jgi:hypothetical protein
VDKSGPHSFVVGLSGKRFVPGSGENRARLVADSGKPPSIQHCIMHLGDRGGVEEVVKTYSFRVAHGPYDGLGCLPLRHYGSAQMRRLMGSSSGKAVRIPPMAVEHSLVRYSSHFRKVAVSSHLGH